MVLLLFVFVSFLLSKAHLVFILSMMVAKMATVAVVGAGPSGLSMLKTLRHDGFKVTLFERRPNVGGLWAFSDNPTYTSALQRTTAALSKYTCGFSDYPVPDRYPTHMAQPDWQEFMHDYATHFDLYKDIELNSTVRNVYRDAKDTEWLMEIETKNGAKQTRNFDKIVFAHGYQTKAHKPTFPGQDNYTGTVMHAQEYKQPEQLAGKKVVLLGLTTTANDIAADLHHHAESLHVAHRRGTAFATRWQRGTPADLLATWRRRMLTQWLAKHYPKIYRRFVDTALKILVKWISPVSVDPAWRVMPFPSITLKLPAVLGEILPLLEDGTVKSLYGIKRFLGGKRIEFDDGTILDDVDAVLMCTGYKADFSPTPFIETSKPDSHGYNGDPLYRLYMNMFPPKYADSVAMLCYSAYGKNNGFSFADVTAMAISNAWRGVSQTLINDQPAMERWIDEHQEWIASLWAEDRFIDTSMVRQWEFQSWLHESAGTGMENLGWGVKGWKFWWKDRKMYNLMNHGVETAHMFRYFETGKRETWEGARDEIIHQNEVVKKSFPVKEKVEKP